MDAESVLKLFDSRWFEGRNYKSLQFQESPSTAPEISPSKPLSVLQTIPPSRKKEGLRDSGEETEPSRRRRRRSRRGIENTKQRKRGTKSLSDLEFEEVKGFMDLGFVFSEEDQDSNLLSVIPGLQRMKETEDDEENKRMESGISRPYLSEAWDDFYGRREEENLLKNWIIPTSIDEVDLKDNLKWWAQAVASSCLMMKPLAATSSIV